MAAAQPRLGVFVSYSHADATWRERVQVHLRPLARDELIDLWDDTRIKAGEQWRAEIRKALTAARVAILLISADFFGSDFIDADELPPLLEAERERGLVILCVHIGPSRFTRHSVLSAYHSINAPERPIGSLSKAEQDAVFDALARRIEELLAASPKARTGRPISQRRQRNETNRGDRDAGDPRTASRRQMVEPSRHGLGGGIVLLLGGMVVLLLAISGVPRADIKRYRLDLAGGSGYLTETLTGIRRSINSPCWAWAPLEWLQGRRCARVDSTEERAFDIVVCKPFDVSVRDPLDALRALKETYAPCLVVEGEEEGRISISVDEEAVTPWTGRDGRTRYVCGCSDQALNVLEKRHSGSNQD